MKNLIYIFLKLKGLLLERAWTTPPILPRVVRLTDHNRFKNVLHTRGQHDENKRELVIRRRVENTDNPSSQHHKCLYLILPCMFSLSANEKNTSVTLFNRISLW